jgi:hypothetical protein
MPLFKKYLETTPVPLWADVRWGLVNICTAVGFIAPLWNKVADPALPWGVVAAECLGSGVGSTVGAAILFNLPKELQFKLPTRADVVSEVKRGLVRGIVYSGLAAGVVFERLRHPSLSWSDMAVTTAAEFRESVSENALAAAAIALEKLHHSSLVLSDALFKTAAEIREIVSENPIDTLLLGGGAAGTLLFAFSLPKIVRELASRKRASIIPATKDLAVAAEEMACLYVQNQRGGNLLNVAPRRKGESWAVEIVADFRWGTKIPRRFGADVVMVEGQRYPITVMVRRPRWWLFERAILTRRGRYSEIPKRQRDFPDGFTRPMLLKPHFEPKI